MEAFIALGEANPDAPIAPRAFLAGAAAYADFARGDSLVLMAALPDSLAPALFQDTLSTETDLPAAGGPLEEDSESRQPDDQDADVDDEELQEGLVRSSTDREPDDEELLDVDDEERPQAPRPVGTPEPVVDEDVDLVVRQEAPVEPNVNEAEEDSLSIPAGALLTDSLRTASVEDDSLRAPIDSTVAPVELALPDSLAVLDSLVAADSLLAPPAPSFTLADYLDALAERYPGTIEAEQALALSAALPRPERPDEPEAEEEPVAVELPGQVEPDEEELAPAAPDPPVTPPVDLNANPYGTFGDQPLNPVVGGFSRRTNALADATEASELVRQLVEEGFRAAVATDGEDIFVVVGQYPSDKDLALATAELPAATLGAGTGIVRLEDIDLLPLTEEINGR